MCKLCENLSNLDEIESISLCPNVEVISIMKNLLYLDIFHNFNKIIFSIPAQPKLKQIQIWNCDTIDNIEVMPKIERLEFRDCKNIPKIPIMPELYRIEFRDCKNIQKIPMMPKLNLLCYHRCHDLIKITEQPNIDELIMIECPNVIKVEKMKKLTSLYIRDQYQSEFFKINNFPFLKCIYAPYKFIKKLPIDLLYLNIYYSSYFNYTDTSYLDLFLTVSSRKKKRLRVLTHLQKKIKLKHNTRRSVSIITYVYHPLYIIGWNAKKQLENSLNNLTS